MPNKFVIFPAGKLASAQAYKAWADAEWQAMSGEVNGVVGLLNTDAFGQHVTTYLGPPYVFFDVVPEPAGGPAMRADGVLHDNWVRPPSEEE
jgi:hypothetical protein